jgi:hypothetical protein
VNLKYTQAKPIFRAYLVLALVAILVPITLQLAIPSRERLDAHLKAEIETYISHLPLAGTRYANCLTKQKTKCVEEYFAGRSYDEKKFWNYVRVGTNHDGVSCTGVVGFVWCETYKIYR